MIDFYLPATDLSLNSAHYGFASGPMDVLSYDDGSFQCTLQNRNFGPIRQILHWVKLEIVLLFGDGKIPRHRKN